MKIEYLHRIVTQMRRRQIAAWSITINGKRSRHISFTARHEDEGKIRRMAAANNWEVYTTADQFIDTSRHSRWQLKF